MAMPTPVNGQMTDAADDERTDVVSDAPAVAIATVYQNLAHSSALAMQNAVQHQQNTWTVQMAVTAKLVQQILSDNLGGVLEDPLYDLFDDLGDEEDDF